MNTKAMVWWALILIAGLLVVSVAGGAIYVGARKSRLYAAGKAAAAAGQWPEAFAQFRALVELDPDYRDAQNRLDEAIHGAVEVAPGGKDLNAEIELLRWLAASGDLATLAEALDRSVVYIPAGEFLMGSNTEHENERLQRLVYLDAFEIDRYEVTNVQYQRSLKATGRKTPPYWFGDEYPPGQANYPVVGVSWIDAEAYCAWIGKRLPTEAEWEKACRGTDGRVYPWGDTWDSNLANVDVFVDLSRPVGQTGPGSRAWDDAWVLLQATSADSGGPGLRPVGSYLDGASPYGVVDLVGSASEWVSDWYNWDGYWDLPARNPLVLGPQWNRCLRGSSWYYPYRIARWAQELSRCSARNSSHVAHGEPRVGFRCAYSVP